MNHEPHCPIPRAAERGEGAVCLCRQRPVATKMERLLAGERVVVDDEWLDAAVIHPQSNNIRTCMNRKRMGIHDQYVAWIAESAAPPDLEYRQDPCKGQVAVGSP